MTRTYRIRTLERRLQYEVRQLARAPTPEAQEKHIVRYMFLDRRYTNVAGRHYVPQQERA